MDTSRIQVSYNEDLKPLESLLANVSRPGDFYAYGGFETAMPRLEVEGVGLLSFPVPGAQIQQLVQQAERAPYGRGGETLLDTSVRNVWQITPSRVRLGGRSWEGSFQQILAQVTAALGCAEAGVSAELYKLLVYDQGGFFKPHRDTEKVEGMFGTLVVVLPSVHRGGELVVRHAGREVVLDLSSSEVSEIKFAAFYADCEHEVRPVTEGNRVCLIYNLLQRKGKAGGKPLTAPLYETEIAKAAKILEDAFKQASAPAKLAWLFEHQYSPAGLSFAGLKGEDSALAKVLLQAGERAGCAVHLGIVHIEETGPAQPTYDSYSSRRRRYHDADDEEDVSDSDFEVVEISDASRFVDQWRDAQDDVIDFGKLPLEEGEILPDGALEDEDPDEQRLMEATGNEGATFERSYHRAALVLWPRDRFAKVLLQAGVGAVLPYLRQQIDAFNRGGPGSPDRGAVLGLAAEIIATWEKQPPYPVYSQIGRAGTCAEMLQLLNEIGDSLLLTRFIRAVLPYRYDGSENGRLVEGLPLLGPETAAEVLSHLVRENMRTHAVACISLLARCQEALGEGASGEWRTSLREMAKVLVHALPRLPQDRHAIENSQWWRTRDWKPLEAEAAADLLGTLAALDPGALLDQAAAAMIGCPAVFDPARILVPGLKRWRKRAHDAASGTAAFWQLWQHAADTLLARSEFPPAVPRDWRQNVKLSCKCADCAELQKFALDPTQRVYRFRARQDKRDHVENSIRGRMDVECVTDRSGSPQTLVCTKTRATYDRQCQQHKADIASLQVLADLAKGHTDSVSRCERISAARGRKPAVVER